MALRELLLDLGIRVDKAGVDKADSALSKLKKGAIAVGGVFVAGKFAQGVRKILDLGSSANETTNVINAAFGRSGDAVEEWAKRQSKAMGRSRFELREMAAATGAIVQPMLGSKDAAADMATQVSQLAVDLGSFFNANDADALRALQSGLIGSTEPLLKFGVVMKQSNLQTFAQQQGIKKSVKEMNEAEITQLRFNFIMMKTKNAQGDAAKTSAGYANATKALRAKLKDTFTVLGQKLVPIMERLLPIMVSLIDKVSNGLSVVFKALDIIIETIVGTFGELEGVVEKAIFSAGLLGLAFVVLGKKSVIAGAKVMWSWIKALAPILAIGAAIAIVLLVIEDVIGFFQGKDSLIGEFIKGFEKWVEKMGGVREAIQAILAKIIKSVFGASEETAQKIAEVFSFIPGFVASVFAGIKNMFNDFIRGVRMVFDELKQTALSVKEFLTGGQDTMVKRIKAARAARAKAAKDNTESALLDLRISRGLVERSKSPKADGKDRSDAAFAALMAAKSVGESGISGLVGQRNTSSVTNNVTTTNNTPIHVTVDASGVSSPSEVAEKVASKVSKISSNRNTRHSFTTVGAK